MNKESIISKIYKRNSEDIALFFWIEGQRRIIPTITIEQSLNLFIKYNGSEKDIDSLRVYYHRMKKEFLNAT